MEPNNSFGDWLRRRRKALDLTQDELARQVGCAIGTLKKIETDERRPSKQMAERLADCLALPTSERAAFLKVARHELAVDGLAVAVQPPERPQDAPRSPSLPSGTVTFLFTDIEGSTHLWAHIPQAMPQVLARHEALLRTAIDAHGGVVFKTMGDAVCAAFASALDALQAALAAQRALAAESWDAIGLPHGQPLRVRMALHTGMVELNAGDYQGLPLSRVARLLAAGHGAQILLSAATQELVRDQLPAVTALHDLGVHRLKDLDRSEPIFQVVAPDLPSDFPPLRTLDIRRHNLPTQPTALIGREQEVARVLQLLQQPAVRLITLTGPGGIGKTRLAFQVAAELLDAFPNGVWFVNLASISDIELVAATIAQTLGMLEAGAQPLIAHLQSYLRAKQLLLLLDNFEQVVAAAPDIAALLAAAPGLTVIVTSRTVLHLAGENELVVPPLAVPDQAHLPAVDQLTHYAAVRLFIDRAQAARADFQVTNANASDVAAICARLDGLPLAIELAAARVKLFAPQALLARLSNRLTFLSGGARDLPARQRTLRDTIAWSYDLLDAGEKTIFARLGVFVGGCTLEAAAAICATNGGIPMDVVDAVAALVDKSLLHQLYGADGEPRFVMLETIREYALEQLVRDGAAPTARQQHAAYYLALAERAEPELHGPAQRTWLDQLELEIDNLRAALHWALAQGVIDSVARLGVALARFWEWRDHLQEGRRWLEAALQPGAALELSRRAAALRVVARLFLRQEGIDQAERYLRESLALQETLGDQRELARVRAELGWLLVAERGDWAQATPLLEASLAQGRALGEPGICAWALGGLGVVADMRGDWAAARASFAESLALRQMLGDQAGTAWGFVWLGDIALAQGDYTEAHSLFTQRLMVEQALNHKQGIASSLSRLGDSATIQRQLDAAAAYYAASLELARDIGDTSNIVLPLLRLGMLAQQHGDVVQATALLGESLRLAYAQKELLFVALNLAALAGICPAPERGAHLAGAAAAMLESVHGYERLWPIDRTYYDRTLQSVQNRLEPPVLAQAWAAGRAMTLEQAIAEAMADAAEAPIT